ncbi:hypothetical protein [Streptomyces flavofungini]
MEESFPLDEVRQDHLKGESNRTRGKLVPRVVS